MEYFENVYEIPELPGYYFKFKRVKPTRLFAMTMVFSRVLTPGANPDMDTLEKVGDFIVENVLFAKEKEDTFNPMKLPGLDSYEFKELETNPLCINYLMKLYFENVITPTQKH